MRPVQGKPTLLLAFTFSGQFLLLWSSDSVCFPPGNSSSFSLPFQDRAKGVHSRAGEARPFQSRGHMAKVVRDHPSLGGEIGAFPPRAGTQEVRGVRAGLGLQSKINSGSSPGTAQQNSLLFACQASCSPSVKWEQAHQPSRDPQAGSKYSHQLQTGLGLLKGH